MHLFSGRSSGRRDMITRCVLCLLLLGTMGGAAQAKTWIADANNDPIKGDHVFSDLQSAVDAASAGDVIQVMPTTADALGVKYTATIAKKLTIVGPGFSPYKNNSTRLARVSLTLLEGASGTKLIGLQLDNASNPYPDGGSGDFQDILIENCSGGFSFTSPVKNLTVRNCIFFAKPTVNPGFGRSEDVIITNNIFFLSSFRAAYFNIRNTKNIIITNNHFSSSNITTLGTIEDALITNNTFQGLPNLGSFEKSARTQFINNLIFSDSEFGVSSNEFPSGNDNVIANNIFDQDPQFVNATWPSPGADLFDGRIWNELDLRLREGSPAKGVGTGGTDIGIFGGQFPFNAFITGGSAVPEVVELITSGVVKKGSPLKVSVKARGN